MLRFSSVSVCLSFIWVTHLVNGAQFLNATLVFSLPPVAVIYPVTSMHASNNQKDLI